MKKLISVLMAAAILISLIVPASAAFVSLDEAADTLMTLGLIKGDENGVSADRAPNRQEAVVMLLRLLGLEDDAEKSSAKCVFYDARGTWAERSIAYAQTKGLVKGITSSKFGYNRTVSVRDYLTLLLRALGYTEGTDFTWAGSIAFADFIGLTHGEYTKNSEFLREDMILTSYTALTVNCCGGTEKLIERLYKDGAVSYSSLVKTRLSGYANTGLTTYTAQEIYERSSSAVFLAEGFTEEADEKPSNTSSGFFITSDGVAVMSFHAITDIRRVLVTTTDGHKYPVTDVIYYDAFRDIAVLRVSRTDTDGNTVLRFPYLDVGDSDAILPGDRVYTVSNPLGLADCITEGTVSSKLRTVDDPKYPCIQTTSPISSGSSGGALIDEYGRAIGVVYGSFTSGESLNLFVPINCINDVGLTSAGESLTAIDDRIDALKKSAVITADDTTVTVRKGESATITVSSDCPVPLNLICTPDEAGIVSCEWGNPTSKQSYPLTITGVEKGRTTLRIKFYGGCGNEDFVLNVTVSVINPPADQNT